LIWRRRCGPTRALGTALPRWPFVAGTWTLVAVFFGRVVGDVDGNHAWVDALTSLVVIVSARAIAVGFTVADALIALADPRAVADGDDVLVGASLGQPWK
jgi:hypothetical protein